MTVGLLVAAAGMLLLLRVGPDASYLLDVLPAVTVFGLGLSAMVAPLTATVLDSAEDRHAGVASGVNNAIARAAGLLAVAVVPAVAGLSGDDYTDPVALAGGFRIAILCAAGLLVVGAVLTLVAVRGRLGAAVEPEPIPVAAGDAETPPQRDGRLATANLSHCAVCGPQFHPRDASTRSSR